jgi:hypothetical protein
LPSSSCCANDPICCAGPPPCTTHPCPSSSSPKSSLTHTHRHTACLAGHTGTGFQLAAHRGQQCQPGQTQQRLRSSSKISSSQPLIIGV